MPALEWIGARARWFLALGVIAALIIPGPGALLAGTVPFWVALLYGLAMTRIDLGAVARRAVSPRRLTRNVGLLVLLMAVTPALALTLASSLDAPQKLIEALVYTTAAPPLGSAAAFCLMLGLDAAFALELTVLGSLIAPVSMPIVTRALLGEALPVDGLEMLTRLGVLIGLATLGAIIVRRLLGAARIDRHALRFDGAASLILVLFLFPLFHGMPELIAAMPIFALTCLGAAFAANLGVQIAGFPILRRLAGRETGGAVTLAWGNRNAALTLAFLPDAPLVTLYIALYQFPMYMTPLVMRPVIGAEAPKN
ncbi:MAG: hypothetical protein AAGD13_14380 [Pseudomonadota bacterium]